MKHRTIAVAAMSLALGCVLATGCATGRVVPVATRTPASFGHIKLYGTDNVPFEYEELGVIGQLYDKQFSMDQCLRMFAEEAEKLGADAILNFRVEPGEAYGGFILVLGDHYAHVTLTGVAVRIKKP